MKIKYIWLLFIVFGLTACVNDDNSMTMEPAVELTAGSADFSKFVAVGNSLTAGFTDNALFIAGQNNSFPNILAQQFGLLGGGAFAQPLMNDNFGGMSLGGTRILNPRLVTTGGAPLPLESVIGPVMPTTDLLVNNPTGPFNNMGVPGARSLELLAPGYGNLANFPAAANPYFIRMTGATPDATVLEMALAQAPTFFSLWIGNNDVLGYATSGGDGSSPLTDVPTFTGAYNAIVGALAGSGAKGVVANIPDVTTIPFFTSVVHNELDPSDPAFAPQIPALNAAYAPLNAAFDFLGVPERKVVFSDTEASAMVIHDESLANISAQLNAVLQGGGLDPLTAGLLAAQYGQSRQANETDLFTLLSGSVIGTLNEPYFNQLLMLGVPAATAGQLAVNGLTYPMEDQHVLLPSEQLEVKTATDAFNSVIAAAAGQSGLGLVDANALLTELAAGGIASDDFILTSDLVLGGAFSLDGVHPNSRGYALIANEFLKAIDAAYGSTFSESGNLVDIGDYPTNFSPLLQ
ncbi:MAG: G-D-S-L family lipolytic protein [Bacteroidia bacterium]|nr:G-D-S-L family lipolytic protein [Bacteroidia bacterium]